MREFALWLFAALLRYFERQVKQDRLSERQMRQLQEYQRKAGDQSKVLHDRVQRRRS